MTWWETKGASEGRQGSGDDSDDDDDDGGDEDDDVNDSGNDNDDDNKEVDSDDDDGDNNDDNDYGFNEYGPVTFLEPSLLLTSCIRSPRMKNLSCISSMQ